MPRTLPSKTATFFMLFLITATSVAQDRKVSEKCDSNSECQSGNCVQLKKESKKVCLYCDQSKYNSYWSDVERRCKGFYPDTFSYSNIQNELKKQFNKKKEVSLPYLIDKREVNVACLKARSTRENSCWKDKMDSGHKEQLENLKKALGYIDSLISESKRNGRAYSVDRNRFDNLLDDEDDECKGMSDRYDKLSDIDEDQAIDCRAHEDLIDDIIDCKEVRKDIIGVFKYKVSNERKNELDEIVAFQSEAEKVLAQKKGNNLCK